MTYHFAKLAYTPAVQELQRRVNGQEMPLGRGPAEAMLGGQEEEFIAARDSFYLATVSETGWPHVQHRGGPAGFLKVIAGDRLAFADVGGNRQYVSVGNLHNQPRVALILMDYPRRRRLKILGLAEVYPADAAPAELLPALQGSTDGRVERVIAIRIAAFDWNCSQHITPRYSAAELQAFGLLDPSNPTGDMHETL